MAKNNFKKKKTLKRSFRRNHTKKVAHAPLGSRTLNIRKKNRRSQKQRATLRNKRNARAKIGGGFAWDALLTAKANNDAGIEMTHEKLARVTAEKEEKARRWEAKKKEYNEKIPLELRQKHNNTAIQHKLKHICEKMHNVENKEQEYTLFDAAEKLILSKNLSDKDIKAAKQEVLNARNEGPRRPGWSPMKDWYFTYEYGSTKPTPAYIDTKNQYKYPQDIEDKTTMLEEDIINNPTSLQWPSEYNSYKNLDDDDDDDDDDD